MPFYHLAILKLDEKEFLIVFKLTLFLSQVLRFATFIPKVGIKHQQFILIFLHFISVFSLSILTIILKIFCYAGFYAIKLLMNFIWQTNLISHFN